MRPPGAPRVGEPFQDWRDFTDRVCRPWIDNDGLDDKAEAWYSTLFLQMTPYYLATALVMADNRIREYEASHNGSYGTGSTPTPGCGEHAP